MSIKQDLQIAKEEFSSDEKMLESVFRIEAFIRKYKLLFIALIMAGLGWIAWFYLSDYLKEQRAIKSTALMEKIQSNLEDESAWNELKKENAPLYEMMRFSYAIKGSKTQELEQMKSSSNPFISTYATYEVSSLNRDFSGVKEGGFSDLALLQEGYLLIGKKEYSQARNKLNAISNTSELKDFALRIGHYGITQ